ncbi:unnamed protein product [Amoebophrya sp. A120]|nr:unnamed protein product [Amoebophrya sp. A120]|eukprot:GSA120T00013048001.1
MQQTFVYQLHKMAHLVDLNEDQFRVLDPKEQCKIAKSAVAAAIDFDNRIIKQFEDAIRQYHRALQYVNLVDSSLPESEELLQGAAEYFRRQRFLKAQLEEMKKQTAPENNADTTVVAKAEALGIAVKGSVLTLHQTHKLGEKAEKIKGDVVTNSKAAWSKTTDWFSGTVDQTKSWWKTNAPAGWAAASGSSAEGGEGAEADPVGDAAPSSATTAEEAGVDASGIVSGTKEEASAPKTDLPPPPPLAATAGVSDPVLKKGDEDLLDLDLKS